MFTHLHAVLLLYKLQQPSGCFQIAGSPVHRARKFSAVFGTMSACSSITMRPRGAPSAVTSKNTRGLACVTDTRSARGSFGCQAGNAAGTQKQKYTATDQLKL